MARLRRLRWVPMLIRAYYDAQNQVQTRSATSVANTDEVESETAPATTISMIRSRPPSGRMKRSRRPKPLVKPVARPLATLGASLRADSNLADRNARLLRELRATNQKLRTLESIERQLKQLGARLDGFNQQISELKHQGHEKHMAQAGADMAQPATGERGDASASPPYPF